jgi:hypothetical protein
VTAAEAVAALRELLPPSYEFAVDLTLWVAPSSPGRERYSFPRIAILPGINGKECQNFDCGMQDGHLPDFAAVVEMVVEAFTAPEVQP